MDTIAGVEIANTALVHEATQLVRNLVDDLIFQHSRRVYLFGAFQGRRRGLVFDPELLYVAAMFHDLGLTAEYGPTGRVEVDSANAARDFILNSSSSVGEARTVWLAIALHATPVADYMEPEIAMLSAGVATDVLEINIRHLSTDEIDQVTAAHPRPDHANAVLRRLHACGGHSCKAAVIDEIIDYGGAAETFIGAGRVDGVERCNQGALDSSDVIAGTSRQGFIEDVSDRPVRVPDRSSERGSVSIASTLT